MSTPTPSNTKGPHAHNAATPNNLTHLGAFSSPAVRSVPSPAAHRNTISGKSPLTASQAPSSSFTAQNHPTNSSTGGASDVKKGGLLGSSPAGVGINFDSPSGALGLNLGAGGAVDMGVSLSQMGGLGMGISMSGLGIGIGGGSSMGLGARADDEERRRRLEGVIAVVKSRYGRVCEEGIKRTAKRVGLALEVNDVRSDPGKKVVTLAGTSSLMVDIEIRSDVVEKVKMECEGASESWRSSSDVLFKDLTAGSSVARMNLTLEKFSRNLEVLSRMEKLSTASVSCFAAVSGVYNSLRKLYEHEKNIAASLIDSKSPNADMKIEREVMCKKSGRPVMNGEGRVGLSLEYWMDQRHVFRKPRQKETSPDTPNEDAMDIDSPSEKPIASEEPTTYSIQIECDSSPPGMYQPIRVSDAWISESIERSDEDLGQDIANSQPGSKIDWLDPPSTFIQEEGGETIAIGNTPDRLPAIKFVARFSPPLVLPLQIAISLAGQVQSQIETIRPVLWDSLVLSPGSEGEMRIADGVKEIRSERSVLVRTLTECERKHMNALFLPRNEFGMALEQIPFEHPRQLIQMLPTLRQYASLNSLLHSTYSPNPPPTRSASSISPASTNSPTPLSDISLDVTLDALQPHPRLTVTFPSESPSAPPNGANGTSHPEDSTSDVDEELDNLLLDSSTAETASPLSVVFEIQANADIVVAAQNVDPKVEATYIEAKKSTSTDEQEDAAKDQDVSEAAAGKKRQRLGRALDICGDLGVWVEWVRSEHVKLRNLES